MNRTIDELVSPMRKFCEFPTGTECAEFKRNTELESWLLPGLLAQHQATTDLWPRAVTPLPSWA